MRYMGNRNPFKRPRYPSCAGCYLVREVAEKLSRVQEELEKRGYGLIVLDAYRPYSMQPLLWMDCEDWGPHLGEISCPAEDDAGHNRGTAVDVTLTSLSGASLAMPSPFGEQCTAARYDCHYLPPHIYHNRCILETAMRHHGFIPCPNEWWHFDYISWSCYPVLDVKFEELCKQKAAY